MVGKWNPTSFMRIFSCKRWLCRMRDPWVRQEALRLHPQDAPPPEELTANVPGTDDIEVSDEVMAALSFLCWKYGEHSTWLTAMGILAASFSRSICSLLKLDTPMLFSFPSSTMRETGRAMPINMARVLGPRVLSAVCAPPSVGGQVQPHSPRQF